MIYKSNIYYLLNDKFYCDYKGSDTFSLSLSNEFEHFIFLFFLSNRLYLFTNKNIYIYSSLSEFIQVSLSSIPSFCFNCADHIPELYLSDKNIYIKCECQPEVCMELKDYISKYYQNKNRMYLYKKTNVETTTVKEVKSKLDSAAKDIDERLQKAGNHLDYLDELYEKLGQKIDEWDAKSVTLLIVSIKCYILNQRIIKFLELLIENYENINEKWYNNIIRNTTFNTNKLIDEDFTHAINCLIHFTLSNIKK